MTAVGTTLEPFLAWLLETTLVASVVICLILALQKLLGRRLGPRWSHALWLVLLLRMVLPWTPPSPVSLFRLVPASLLSDAAREITDSSPHTDAPRAIDSAGPTETTAAAAPAPAGTPDEPRAREIARTAHSSTPLPAGLRRMLPLLWLAGAVLLAGYLAASNFALWRIIKREHPLTKQPILELFEQCKTQMGVQTIVALVSSDRVRTAALFGFVRPRLLMPRQMLDTATQQEMRYVFLHELAHLKRHDIYLGWLASLLQVLHWFNPLVWLAFHRMRTDRELACDALVLTRTGRDKSHEYGRTMLGVLQRFSRAQSLPALAGVLESKSQLKRRIAMIAQFKHSSYRWSPLAAVLIVILACISLPDAEHTKASETSAGEHTDKPNFRKIRIPTKPQNGVLSPDGNKLAFMSDDAVWVVPLHGKVDPDIAGEPVRLAEVPGIWDASNMMAWSADGKWIAVYGQSDKEDGVYIIPAAGGRPRVVQLPEQGGHLWSYRLSLSPDGQILAFSALELGKRREEVSQSHDRCIYTIPTAGGKPTQVSSGWARLPSFSPDGRFIAYVGYGKQDNWQKNTRLSRVHGDLWVVPSAGGTPVKLATVEGRLRGPVWSPDGKYIAAHYEPGGTNDSKEIWVFPLSPDASSAGEPEKIALPRSSMNMLAGWTPEGQLGVFLESEEHWAGYTVPSSGGQAVQITPESIVPYYPRWSPDGERIYFRGVYKDKKNVKIETLYVPAAGGDTVEVAVQSERRLVARVPGGGLNVSPDGKKIVFSAFQMPYDPKEGTDIWTISLDGGLPTRLTNDGSSEGYPCWSPDGQQIAFVDSHRKSDGESFNAIYVVPAEGGEIRQVSSESDNIRDGAIAFSPDVERIAFFSSDGAIRTIPVGGGQAEMLVAEVKADRHSQLSYSPDGSKIAYNTGGKIWITSLGGGKPEELRTGLPKNAKLREFGWSPDGEKIAFIASSGGEKEFWLIENFLPQETGK